MDEVLYFLGVDGGQSSTTALIADNNGTVLGQGTGGPCNHVGAALGPAKLKRTVQECVSRACEAAGLDAAFVFFESACFGMSGGPDDKEPLLREILRTRLLTVTDDATTALAGAFAGGPGVVTIAGTGSIALARDEQGGRARAGGWGYIFGDEGGAFDIVRQALRAALRYEEGWGEPTGLRDLFLRETGEATMNAVLHAFYTEAWPRARVAALAALVARADDDQAREIQRAAGRALASYALAARGSLCRFSYIGGVFQSELVLESFRGAIEAQAGCRVIPPRLDAAHGALLEAFRAAGQTANLKFLADADTIDS